MDKIIIRDLKTKSIIGTRPEERTKKQTLKFNIELDIDLKTVGVSDDLNDTVNYQEIEQKIKKMAEKSEFFLIEKMAEEAAKICLQYDKIVKAAITIDKPSALKNSRSVAVRIERTR
ncbi:MAG: dihydroneopterin aldolase [Victivallaceae bacterium]